MKVYGPYEYMDRSGKRRLLVNLVDKDGKKSQSYPRYLMEQHLGRKLEKNEDVDHIDRNPLNNCMENLRVLPARVNRGMHVSAAEYLKLRCPICGVEFSRLARRVREKIKKGASGPFCTKKCARQYQLQAPVA